MGKTLEYSITVLLYYYAFLHSLYGLSVRATWELEPIPETGYTRLLGKSLLWDWANTKTNNSSHSFSHLWVAIWPNLLAFGVYGEVPRRNPHKQAEKCKPHTNRPQVNHSVTVMVNIYSWTKGCCVQSEGKLKCVCVCEHSYKGDFSF